jgi:hypothetical protein
MTGHHHLILRSHFDQRLDLRWRFASWFLDQHMLAPCYEMACMIVVQGGRRGDYHWISVVDIPDALTMSYIDYLDIDTEVHEAIPDPATPSAFSDQPSVLKHICLAHQLLYNKKNG